MFKKFDEKESVSGISQLKSSVQKGIKAKLVEQFPYLENYINSILPKKDTLRIVKCHEHVEILVGANGELLFFKQREGPYFPSLRLLHKYPFICPWEQVDKGAIRFVLSGANIMCPGLTSPGAKRTTVPKGSVVAIMAEGKQHALAVGLTSMSTDDINVTQFAGNYPDTEHVFDLLPVGFVTARYQLNFSYCFGPENKKVSINKGIGVENIHYLNDGLWHMKPVK